MEASRKPPQQLRTCVEIETTSVRGPGWCSQWLDHQPAHCRVEGSITSQGHLAGLQVRSLTIRLMREATKHGCSLLLPPPFHSEKKKINGKDTLCEGKKGVGRVTPQAEWPAWGVKLFLDVGGYILGPEGCVLGSGDQHFSLDSGL